MSRKWPWHASLFIFGRPADAIKNAMDYEEENLRILRAAPEALCAT